MDVLTLARPRQCKYLLPDQRNTLTGITYNVLEAKTQGLKTVGNCSGHVRDCGSFTQGRLGYVMHQPTSSEQKPVKCLPAAEGLSTSL